MTIDEYVQLSLGIFLNIGSLAIVSAIVLIVQLFIIAMRDMDKGH